MVESVDFDSFIAQVGDSEALPALRIVDGTIRQPDTVPAGFLAPRLRPDGGSGPNPRVLLLRAPAAVGKSWMARAMSARSGNPLWDLSRFRLGSNFFTGTLALYYGGAGYERFEDLISRGGTTLILDAADEALVGAGISNYEAAIRDLVQLLDLDSAPLGPSAVILGRPETLELTAVILEAAGVPWRMYNVAYFDQEERRQFVAGKVQNRRPVSPPDVYRFVDGFTSAVGTAMLPTGATEVEVAEFLGYAPVLDALAAFYSDQENPHAKLSEIQRDQTHAYAWNLLMRVIDAICERERGKLRDILAAEDPALGAAAYEFFNREEQVRLLLAEEREERDLNLPAGLTVPQEQRLVDAWDQQFAEHPFRSRSEARVGTSPLARFSSVVFRDYCAALGFLTFDDLQCLELSGWMNRAEYQPSPMFVRFLSNLPKIHEDPFIADFLSCMLDSIQAAQGSLSALVSQGASREGSPSTVVVEVFDSSFNVLSLEVEVERSELMIGRGISYVEVDVPDLGVRLGANHRDFLFGNSVGVVARSVTCDSEDVRVVAAEQAARLEAQRFVSTTARVFAATDAKLEIWTPKKLNYPWHAFGRLASESPASDRHLDEAARDLRRVVTWFARPSMAGPLTYPAEAMDTILGKGRAPQQMFDYCLQVGAVVKDGYSYRLVPPTSVAAIKGFDLSDEKLRVFLTAYTEWVGDLDGEAESPG